MQVIIALGSDDLTSRDLQKLLPDVPQASLYRAIKQLKTGGAIEVVKEQRKGGAIERTYRAVPQETVMTPQEFTSASSGEFIAAARTFGDRIAATAARAVAVGGENWAQQRYSMRHESLWLTREERDQLSNDLQSIYDKYEALGKRDGTSRHALIVAGLPDPRPGHED